jgi:hypothetical protein
MFDQYVKLFNISWIEPWMVEAMAMIAGALILAFVVPVPNSKQTTA